LEADRAMYAVRRLYKQPVKITWRFNASMTSWSIRCNRTRRPREAS